MESKQILPNYTDKYSGNSEWIVSESEHYIFHYFKETVAEKEIADIMKMQEKAYEHIVTVLQLEKSVKKIQYYIYPTEDDKEKMMGDGGNAQAIWHDNSIHIVYDEKVKPLGEHEDTHLLVLDWNRSPIGFLQEGLAEYLSGCIWHKKDATPLAKESIKRNIFVSFGNLFSHVFWMNTSDDDCAYYYSLAGVFSKFLFEKYGLEKYKKLYQSALRENSQEENVTIFSNIYGDFSEKEKEFYLFLGLDLSKALSI